MNLIDWIWGDKYILYPINRYSSHETEIVWGIGDMDFHVTLFQSILIPVGRTNFPFVKISGNWLRLNCTFQIQFAWFYQTHSNFWTSVQQNPNLESVYMPFKLGISIWIPHTHCGRFKKHLLQRECKFQVKKLILALLNEIITPSVIDLI